MLVKLRPSVFFVEESKCKEIGKLKFDNFVIFELIRQNKEGGGLALGCAKELQPVWVREGDDYVEALSVEICVKRMKIRCCIAYGCQENDKVERKDAFWKYLDEDVQLANTAGSGFILHFDGNLWAGEQIIPGDPRSQNRNGKLFQEFLERHPHLSVVNSLPECEGLITRSRIKNGIKEESILDFFVVCDQILPFIKKMVIDQDKKYILTNYQNVKRGGEAIDSDHFTQYMDLNLMIESEKPQRIEIYDFKEKEAQLRFQKITSETSELSNCLKNNMPLFQQVRTWRRKLEKFCFQSFKKIRIRKKFVKPLKGSFSKLIDERNRLLKYDDEPENKKKLSDIEGLIAEEEARENREMIVKNFKDIGDNPENVNLQNMWKLCKKLWPKSGGTQPTAKRNQMGKIVTGPKDIKNVLAKEYKDRLRNRPVRADLKGMRKRKNIIFKMKMKLAKSNPSPVWKMSDLDKALRNLKNNKSRDSEGLINEIFKKDTIGIDLKKSLLIMFNKLKEKKMIPSFLNSANITTVHKKGSKIEPGNQRGIFRVSVVRSILMRLVYDTKYPTIDRNMSDCQMGGRKRKSSKNNIFIINGLIHEVMSSKKVKAILLQIYDYRQMFDSINLQQALSDLYDVGVNDDNLALIHKANKEIYMAVKTPNGLTDRQTISNCVLQGDTWGSILASVQVDSIGKECMEAGHSYLYKNELPVGFLGLVDDIIGVTEVGFKAQMLNVFINLKTAEKTLQFGPTKCKTMLVGKDVKHVINSNLQVDEWAVSYAENVKTGEPELLEKYCGLTDIENVTEQKYLGFVLSSTCDNMANIREIKKKSIGIVKTTLKKLNSLNLERYYFECAVIMLNSMIRSSILYACEMYQQLKENEIRQLERIEESFLRQVLKTTKGCPINQLYLSVGHYPARFEIQRIRLLYLKYILDEEDDSLLSKFLRMQLENKTRGDWASTCLNDLKKLGISKTLIEIKTMSKFKFSKLVKDKIIPNAFKYLISRQGSKGIENNFSELSMAEYLLPENHILSISEKQSMFAVKNRMIMIGANFPKPNISYWCWCGIKENMQHVYECELINEKQHLSLEYMKIYTGNISEQINVFRKFEINMKRRDKMKNENTFPCDPQEIHCSRQSVVLG